MVSSELPELLGLCDRILVMFRGRIAAEFDAAACTEEADRARRARRRRRVEVAVA